MNNFNVGSRTTESNDFLDETSDIDDILREFKDETGDLDWVDAYTAFDDEPTLDTVDDESSNLLARLRQISEVEEMPANALSHTHQTTPLSQKKSHTIHTPNSVTAVPNTHINHSVSFPTNQPSSYQYDVSKTIDFTALINDPTEQTWNNFATELKHLSLEIMTAGTAGIIESNIARNTMSDLIDAIGEANKPNPNVVQITKTIHQLMGITMGQFLLIEMCADVNLAACLIPMLK